MKPFSFRRGMAAFAILAGCIACCAMPILATIGLGGGVALMFARIERNPIAVAIAVVVALTIAALAVRAIYRNRHGRLACDTSCSADQSCCTPKK